MIDGGKIRMPRQEVAKGQKHGYIGEDTGEVEVIDPPEPGDTNALPNPETAERNVEAAKLALERAEADHKRSKEAVKAADKTDNKARSKSEDK